MSKKIIAVLVIAAVILVAAAIGIIWYNSHQTTPADNPEITQGNISNIADANNQLALDIYSQLKSSDGNIFFSSYSISTALAMTYEGARGQTADEMKTVLHFNMSEGERRAAFAESYNELNKAGKVYKLSVANALWAQKDFSFLSEYLDDVERYYGGKATNLDFIGDTENSRLTINRWVENKTNNKIMDLIPRGLLDSSTRLVLTNAIYFKANWSKQFKQESTYDADFYLASKTPIKALMMHQTDNFNYMENKDIQMLEMNYQGNDLSMLVILPKENNLANLESSLQNLGTWKKELTNEKVRVSLPKFKFETKYLMAGILKEMGMPLAFTDDADFSGMTGKRDLKISEVIHQTFLNVSESGTEAAAATAVIMMATSAGPGMNEPEPKIFNANHPFIFIIQEKASGNILFLGKVNNPALN